MSWLRDKRNRIIGDNGDRSVMPKPWHLYGHEALHRAQIEAGPELFEALDNLVEANRTRRGGLDALNDAIFALAKVRKAAGRLTTPQGSIGEKEYD